MSPFTWHQPQFACQPVSSISWAVRCIRTTPQWIKVLIDCQSFTLRCHACTVFVRPSRIVCSDLYLHSKSSLRNSRMVRLCFFTLSDCMSSPIQEGFGILSGDFLSSLVLTQCHFIIIHAVCVISLRDELGISNSYSTKDRRNRHKVSFVCQRGNCWGPLGCVVCGVLIIRGNLASRGHKN